MKKNDKTDFLWALSLIVISVVTVIMIGAKLIGVKLPDAVVHIMGIIDLVMIPLLAWATVRRGMRLRKN